MLLSAFALYQLGKAVRNADPLVKRTAWEYHSASEPVRAAETLRAGELAVNMEEMFSALGTA